MTIVFQSHCDGVAPGQLQGFFVGWPTSPSPETHLSLLKNSMYVELARLGPSGRVIGFVNAISDGTLAAYIPLLEVLPDYQGQGIGKELVRRLLDRLKDLYMIDLMCDPQLEAFYERLGMTPGTGMRIRNHPGRRGISPGPHRT